MRTSLFSFFLFLLNGFFAFGQTTDSLQLPGIFDLLQSDGLKEVAIKTDLAYLIANKRTSQEYLKGDFTFEPSEDVEMTLPVKIRCRGRYRRVKCDFPPLKLKFKKDDLADQNLNEFNELKLVTHCMNEKEVSKDLIMRECLAYKMFNVLTDKSLRAQLVRVVYYNTKGRPKKIKGWGILIEDSDELAYRIGGEKYWAMGIPKDSFNVQQEQLTAFFNYMIGNADWSSEMARNLEFVKDADGKITITPYDFDFAGMVSAPYAVPNLEKGQKTLKDRVFLGRRCQLEELAWVRQHFMDKKEEIMSVVTNAELLATESKEEVLAYLEEFYQIIGNDELVRQEILGEKQEADKE